MRDSTAIKNVSRSERVNTRIRSQTLDSKAGNPGMRVLDFKCEREWEMARDPRFDKHKNKQAK
jgi:hypothetical protein